MALMSDFPWRSRTSTQRKQFVIFQRASSLSRSSFSHLLLQRLSDKFIEIREDKRCVNLSHEFRKDEKGCILYVGNAHI